MRASNTRISEINRRGVTPYIVHDVLNITTEKVKNKVNSLHLFNMNLQLPLRLVQQLDLALIFPRQIDKIFCGTFLCSDFLNDLIDIGHTCSFLNLAKLVFEYIYKNRRSGCGLRTTLIQRERRGENKKEVTHRFYCVFRYVRWRSVFA